MWPSKNEMDIALRWAGLEGGLCVLENTMRLYKLSSSSISSNSSNNNNHKSLLKKTKEDVLQDCKLVLNYLSRPMKPNENVTTRLQQETRLRNVIRDIAEPSLLIEFEKLKTDSSTASGVKRDSTALASLPSSSTSTSQTLKKRATTPTTFIDLT
eukprot:TRINITY_DN3686_c0_g1_i2.p1 TRINITY_DN3686_c0_g1~~TRINITY_DN3686_c0_g1_i2.p1  ORF type:complete len:155 (+),score=42.92 TRINITY_DN3686_c0_g1_i2:477-941(+)